MQYTGWAAQCAYANDGGTGKERIVARSPTCWGRHMDRSNWPHWTQIVHKVIISIVTYYTRHTEGCTNSITRWRPTCEQMDIKESEGRSCCTSPAPVFATWNQDLWSDAWFWWNSIRSRGARVAAWSWLMTDPQGKHYYCNFWMPIFHIRVGRSLQQHHCLWQFYCTVDPVPLKRLAASLDTFMITDVGKSKTDSRASNRKSKAIT
jgi:hypothetical protein